MGRGVIYGLFSMTCPFLAAVLAFGVASLLPFPAAAADVPDTSPRASPVEPVEESEEPENPADEPEEPEKVPVDEPEEVSVEEPEMEPEEPVQEPETEPVTPQIINDGVFLIAGCLLFGIMFLAGLIFSRYVPGGFVRG